MAQTTRTTAAPVLGLLLAFAPLACGDSSAGDDEVGSSESGSESGDTTTETDESGSSSGSEDSTTDTSESSTDTSTSETSTDTGGESGTDTSTDTGQEFCSVEAVNLGRVANVLMVIDNTGSMTQEIAGIQAEIYPSFAAELEAAGVDYRLILLSMHGLLGNEDVCIEEPLSGIAMGGCAMPPPEPVNNPPIFQQYSIAIASHDAACKIVNRWAMPDPLCLAPDGYGAWFDPAGFTNVVLVTDDGANCGMGFNDLNTVAGGETVGPLIDAALLGLDPMWGTDQDRNYRFNAMLGVAGKDPNDSSVPWVAGDPLTIAECPGGVDPGTGYQSVARISEGLVYPLCDVAGYPQIFMGLAAQVIDDSIFACDFEVPEGVVDPAELSLDYTPEGMGEAQTLEQVAGPGACAGNQFYVDAEGVHLCPQACSYVEDDPDPLLEAVYPC